jgi:prepilin-type N-terminal cleavage/methylation domain-containing protein
MKKHQIKRNPPSYAHPLDKSDNLMMKKAFTLVELIIVITILAILATIAFVSFSNYTALSRDTKRIVTIESIAK